MTASASFAFNIFAPNIAQAFASVLLVYMSWKVPEKSLLARVVLLGVACFASLFLLLLGSDATIATRLIASAEYVLPYFAVLLLYLHLTYHPQTASRARAQLACVLIGVALLPVAFFVTFDAPCRIMKDCAL